MKVGVIYFGGQQRDAVAEIARGVASGIEKQGHQVDLIDGDAQRDVKLSIYQYIAVGTVARTFFGGKIDPEISTFLANAGILGGKRCFAFVRTSLLGTQKALRRLMKALEHEGMFIRFSESLRSRAEAELVASRLKVGQ
jgi:menaquinone-dependent protoporphyrinogen IX oxidase